MYIEAAWLVYRAQVQCLSSSLCDLTYPFCASAVKRADNTKQSHSNIVELNTTETVSLLGTVQIGTKYVPKAGRDHSLLHLCRNRSNPKCLSNHLTFLWLSSINLIFAFILMIHLK